ncbi:MAG: DNA-formamidopyrimidine glycosylase family protein [Armatimonadota bacterium]|nr:DNA-formamidopyrimidine glycosylase family protein [Armatimonadota bacterium]MDR7421715.1 DNA-formamidopyrimidine glycosylase family protein [Armatimonadota bacterium]MDR7454568.1 DNA-formamidopyrimidine glycosylase family protein [Armatimonadota bacterium]MDR7495813.1 DNA-formamidopyrimidine glycosylase family protein [Armatimonadota bacterium]MDR7511469.1 DNA-formamidopyrimidine glycosylase family protein [Armatimonadota bacterium]
MPELPEVETARLTLGPLVTGRRIERLDVRRPEAMRSHTPAEAARVVAGRHVFGVDRRGKTLLVHLSGGWTLAFHYALWGVVLVRGAVVPDASTAALLALDDGKVVEFRELQLSNLNLYRTAALASMPALASLGPDPLDPSLTLARFRERLSGRGAIRNMLTDQSRLAGIGNLWALEVLFAAGLRPGRAVQTLSEEQWKRLHQATRSVLRRGIRAGGEPEFIDATGRRGRFRPAVYGRGGQPCRVCGTRIATGRVGGRPAFWCPKCQR